MSAHIFRFERQRFKNFMVISSWNSPDFSEVRAFGVCVKELASAGQLTKRPHIDAWHGRPFAFFDGYESIRAQDALRISDNKTRPTSSDRRHKVCQILRI